jgi:Ca2+-binding RTX toxin-like protein
MIARICSHVAVFGLLALAVVSLIAASAAGNTIAHTNLGSRVFTIDANALKPRACAGLHLSSIVSGSGTLNGNTGNTLILGSAGDDTITGQDGNDCIVGGGGADTLDGGGGNDVLIGGPGGDTCIGGLGTNTFTASCEVQQP